MDIKNSAIQKLSKAIAIETYCSDNSQGEKLKFKNFHSFLEESFPLFHEKVTKEIVDDYALMYRWESAKTDGKNLPFALLAHMDVVGVESGTEQDWKYPPFSGIVADGYIWGRGSLDDKGSLIAILEATEQLIGENYEPDRDIYFCFSYNEESVAAGDKSGAQSMATLLEERGVRFEFVLDEGGVVITDAFMGLTKPIASIGLAEKGYADLKVTVHDSGGHSSRPPSETAITKLADLITNYKKINDKNIVFTETALKTIKVIGENKTGITGFVMRHPKMFLPLIKKQLLADNQTSAMIKTTVAPTVLRAGKDINVLPQKAEGILNIRLIPGEDKATIERRIKEAAGANTKYTLEYIEASPSLPETSSNTETFKLLSTLNDETYSAISLPYLVAVTTDSRKYKNVTDEIYRFSPFAISFEELDNIHDTNERIQISTYLEGLEFYKRFIKESGKR